MRLGRGVFDPRLALLDSHGTVLADVDDTQLAMQDPFFSLVVPADGTYILRLREATYGGNDDCHYRLHIGAFPRPTAVYPMGGKAGETVTLTFFSAATGEFTQPVKLPATPEERFGVFARVGRSAGAFAQLDSGVRVSERAGELRPTRTGSTRPRRTCRRRWRSTASSRRRARKTGFGSRRPRAWRWR